ncbi:MAG: hypothetical protein IKL47_09560 [Clostridia bacterium]|nr:hypothetical protein [Clostridia bacterium]
MEKKWVNIWGQAHSALSHFYYPSCPKTYRLIINSALSGEKIRIELSNEFAKNDVCIGGITVCECNKDGEFIGEYTEITYLSNTSFAIKKGESLFCDEADFTVETGKYMAVSIYVEKGELRSGNLLDNAVLLTVKGDMTKTPHIENQRRKRDKVREVAAGILHMYLHKPIPLVRSVQVLNTQGASSIAVFGDSLCQQGFWTNRFEQRIRETYHGRYSVVNKSIMGNRLLHDFSPRFPCKGLFGPSGTKRLERDVLSYEDTEYVIITLGTNDFLQPGSIAAAKGDTVTASQVFEGMLKVADVLRDRGIKVIVFNLPMFGECIDSRPHKEKTAIEYNRLLSENKDRFYAVYDQMSRVVNPDKPNCTDKKYLGKDNLHYNKAGGDIVADGIDLDLFG